MQSCINILKLVKKYILFFFGLIKYSLVSTNRKTQYEVDYKKIKFFLLNGVNFAFVRFSDGELFMMKDYKIQITKTNAFLGKKKLGSANFTKEEVKTYDPEKHQYYREKLFESFFFDKENYFKGIACTCCNGKREYKYMLELAKKKRINLGRLTFSNLFTNGNYNKFIKDFIKILKNKKNILIVSKYADLTDVPFEITKKFTVGENCMVNDYGLIKKVLKYVETNQIKNHIFLMSSATLSNFLIHELYKKYPENTYIDIGSTLNPIFKMKGWIGSRRYLQEHWLKEKPILTLNKNCYW